MRTFWIITTIALLTACGTAENSQPTSEAETHAESVAETPVASPDRLEEVLARQPADAQARYVYRHPRETLEYFGIEPGMTVAEALPGGGWYSKILLPYLGEEGHLIGVNYATSLWSNFPFANEEYMARMATWTDTWPAGAEDWRDEDSATVSATVFGAISEEQRGTADAILFFRALHNMARFDSEPFLANAMKDAFDLLKPGGIAGIVQHEARAEMPDEWADGSAGYLKQEFVIAQMEAVGFQFDGAAEINQNPADQPTTADVVWRLPPSLRGAETDEQKAAMTAIGESNRMTLKFSKPEA